jgi:hypothetical protein
MELQIPFVQEVWIRTPATTALTSAYLRISSTAPNDKEEVTQTSALVLRLREDSLFCLHMLKKSTNTSTLSRAP